MLFPWHKYEEVASERKNTLQIFVTNRCNLKCEGCFARFAMKDNLDIGIEEYAHAVSDFLRKDGKQINLLGGEPLLHPHLREMLDVNRKGKIKTTVYTNGFLLDRYAKEDFDGIKLRVSLYCESGKVKSAKDLPKTDIPIDVCYMVSKNTSLEDMLNAASYIEQNHACEVFFISSIRELDNKEKEFFRDTGLTMNLFDYKSLVHEFLMAYEGNMEIHISKRGVFESTKTLTGNKCRFANYFIGGKIIQCPYDVVNLKFQKDYAFDSRYCQQNSSCLMSKIVLKRKNPI